MPPVIYAFSLCAFALGFTEFVVIGLVPGMSADLHVGLATVGLAVTAYALGVSVGAPILTALAARWPRRRLLLTAMSIFTLANIAISASGRCEVMLLGRFATGLCHGVFLAVASSVATSLVTPQRGGQAVAYVFSGLTIALVLGVPAGTYLGNVLNWRLVFAAIALFGGIGLIGLWSLMPVDKPGATDTRLLASLKSLFAGRLLAGALVSVLAYSGAFTCFTYLSPLLIDVTHVKPALVGTVLLVFGGAATIGNIAGGHLTDRIGARHAAAIIIGILALALIGIWLFSASIVPTVILVGVLGAAMFAAVPALQSLVMGLAAIYAPTATATAAGLNIAGFNIGITLGSLLGGAVIAWSGLAATALIGAATAVLGVVVLLAMGAAATLGAAPAASTK